MGARAAPLLLVLLAVTRAVPAPQPAPPPPPSPPAVGGGVALVRALCGAHDSAAFSPARLLHAAAARAHLLYGYRLLEYEESCGPAWQEAVARATMRALAAGGALVSVGWPGARACALAAAAPRPAPPPPPACARPAARATLLLHLATVLHWRRALLPPAAGAPGGECEATLAAARPVLLAAGITVRSDSFDSNNIASDIDVAMICADRNVSVEPWPTQTSIVLLQAADDHSTTQDITLDVGNLPYLRKVDNLKNISLDSSMAMVTTSTVTDLLYKINDSKGNELFRTTTLNSSDEGQSDRPRNNIDGSIRSRSIQIVKASLPRFLLVDHQIEPMEVETAYIKLLDAIRDVATLTGGGKLTAYDTFSLLVSYNNVKTNKWEEMAAFRTKCTRRSGDNEWAVAVEVVNMTELWWKWRERAAGAGAGGGARRGAWLVAAGGAAALLLLAGAGAGAAVALARRRRGRRRRADVVLAAADFQFPADEARRVPDGMETMLSCWLQQLHEFGGPDLDRTELLPAPPPPSSTASNSRLALDRRTRYKGDAVQLKALPAAGGALELRRRATDVLLVLHALRHENLNPFIGCVCATRPALVWDHCGRGSLEDVLRADDIKLDWTFRLSLLTDLVKGLRYLHASPLRVHGRLSSRNCVVDSRWVLRLADYGVPDFCRAQGLALPPRRARDLLWTAPELLRAGEGARGTQPGDVYSFAIIMQEVLVRGEPYCMLSLTPEEIVEKLCRPPPLIRPSVSRGAAPPEAVSVMRQCWAEPPDLRPATPALADIFRLLHQGRKINIVDSMFEMLEKYSNNLEELIKERTDQLDMEKKKTEQLLNRILPRSVAERLLLGLRVEPEEFEEVSIYFSDIVGFTAIAARSTPVQVVALLNDLYTTFDAAIERYQVYKVETIGDAYMVVGGLPLRARDHSEHAGSVATMALHLLHLAGRFRVRHLPDTPLHLRIGLHSGPCCAGVVGLTMPRYCLFGDTVNTASRMESTGAAWRIQVSQATAARLQAAGGYRLRSRGLTPIKGKGLMHTYWLLGKDGFDKPLPTPPPLPSEDTLVEHDAEMEPPPPPAPPPMPPPPPNELPLQPGDKYAWQRSGALSAHSSPPAAPAPAPYSRYRCRGGGGGGGRVLRRQWSLERGEALAAARAAPPSPPSAPPPPRPLVLVCEAPRPPRYRTRPDPDAPKVHPSASFD